MGLQQVMSTWLLLIGSLTALVLTFFAQRHVNKSNAKRIIRDAAYNLGQTFEPYPEYRKRRPKTPSRKRIADETRRYASIKARIEQIDHTIGSYDALTSSDRDYFDLQGVDLSRMKDKLLRERAILAADRKLIESTTERWAEVWPNDLRIANIVH